MVLKSLRMLLTLLEARYDGQPVGSCKYSDIAVFSFHPVKIITSGEGGMAVTNSQEIMLQYGLIEKPWNYQGSRPNDYRA